jgi:hypothetical protein
MLAKGESPTSVDLAEAVLHRTFEDAVRWGLVPRNAAGLVRRLEWPARRCRPFPSNRLPGSSKNHAPTSSRLCGFLL